MAAAAVAAVAEPGVLPAPASGAGGGDVLVFGVAAAEDGAGVL